MVTISKSGIYAIGGTINLTGITLLNGSLNLSIITNSSTFTLFNQSPLDIHVGGALSLNYFQMLNFSSGNTFYINLVASGNVNDNINLGANSTLQVFNLVLY